MYEELENCKINLHEAIEALTQAYNTLCMVSYDAINSKDEMDEPEHVECLKAGLRSAMMDIKCTGSFAMNEDLEEIHERLSEISDESQLDVMMNSIEDMVYYIIDLKSYYKKYEMELEEALCGE